MSDKSIAPFEKDMPVESRKSKSWECLPRQKFKPGGWNVGKTGQQCNLVNLAGQKMKRRDSQMRTLPQARPALKRPRAVKRKRNHKTLQQASSHLKPDHYLVSMSHARAGPWKGSNFPPYHTTANEACDAAPNAATPAEIVGPDLPPVRK